MKRFACLLAWLVLAIAPARAEDAPKPTGTIYRWIDQNGVAHYTADPEALPEALREHVPERQPVENPPLAAQAPDSVDGWIARDRVPEAAASVTGAAPTADGAADDPLAALDARILALEEAIAADEALLKGDLSDPSSAPSQNETLKQVADRMPARIQELNQLRAEREALVRASAPTE
jgi:hypothetical protein